jgi:hypothetical protein
MYRGCVHWGFSLGDDLVILAVTMRVGEVYSCYELNVCCNVMLY